MLFLLAGCVAKFGAIHSADVAAGPSTDAVVVGRVRFIVDGQQMRYNILNRPVMRLFRTDDGQYYESVMADGDGGFAWKMPAGDYEIAVLGGGMGPTLQPWIDRRTLKIICPVNGFTYPGFHFIASQGKTRYLGTLLVDVKSRKMNAVINFTGERVFGALNGMTVVDESAADPLWQQWQVRPNSVVGLIEALPGR